MIIDFGGQKHTFPDDFTDDDISAALSAPAPAPAPAKPTVDPAWDAVKSTGIGAVKSVIGLADLPEYGARGIDKATNWVSQKLGLGPVQRPGTKHSFDERFAGAGAGPERSTLTGMELPDARQVQSGIEQATGPFYEPQTPAGVVAERLGGFVPGLIGGPAGLAGRAVTQVAAPFLASEGAGHLAKGTALEGPARVAAALAAGPAAGRVMAGRSAAPTTEALKDASKATYNSPAVRQTGLPVNDVRTVGNNAIGKLQNDGFDPINTPDTFRMLARMDGMNAPTVGDVHNLRKGFSRIGQGHVVTNPSETAAAGMATRQLDDYLDTVSPALRDANANYGAAKRSEKVAEALAKAENNAGGANSGQNIDNATRQAIKAILNNPRQRRGFNEAELAQMKQVVRGTATGNTARYIGNLLGGGGGMGQLVTAGALGGGGYALGDTQGGMAGVAAAIVGGRALKGVANASTARQAAILDDMVRSRAPLAKNKPLQISADREAIARALLRGSAASPSTQSNR